MTDADKARILDNVQVGDPVYIRSLDQMVYGVCIDGVEIRNSLIVGSKAEDGEYDSMVVDIAGQRKFNLPYSCLECDATLVAEKFYDHVYRFNNAVDYFLKHKP